MYTYLYETHLHTSPVSKCARATVRENLEFYKSLGYAGVFLTDHFIDGNVSADRALSYEERLRFFFSAYEEGARLSEEIGIPVFSGLECSYKGTDFLVYGLDMAWFLSHPEIENMKKTDSLALMMASGALVVQAHPFREASYIDHIRLFPRSVEGIEVFNANRTELENTMAEIYAKQYGLLPFAGSDNHVGARQELLGGMAADRPIRDEADFVARVKRGELCPFRYDLKAGTLTHLEKGDPKA